MSETPSPLHYTTHNQLEPSNTFLYSKKNNLKGDTAPERIDPHVLLARECGLAIYPSVVDSLPLQQRVKSPALMSDL